MTDRARSVGESTLVSIFVTALTLWVGGALFFSAVIVPLLFTNMRPSEAGVVAAVVFPYYYLFGTSFGVVLFAVSAWFAAGGRRRWQVASAFVGVMLACQLYGHLVVYPEMTAVKANPTPDGRFNALHELSVRLNAVVLLGGVCLLLGGGALLDRRD